MITNILKSSTQRLKFHNQILRLFSLGANDDPYKLLGVDKSASKKDIKRAYKKATLKHHPDKGGDPDQFKKIQESYEVTAP
jgi:DnaJ-class molecular chaperone